MNKHLAWKTTEILSVSAGMTMGVSALAALPWYLDISGLGIVAAAWFIVYKFLLGISK